MQIIINPRAQQENMGSERRGSALAFILIFWPAALLNVVAYALYFIAMHLTYVGSLQGHYLV